MVSRSLSVRLLNCNYSGHSFNLKSRLVDSGNEVRLFKKNLYSPAKCSHFCGLQQFHMGCHLKSGQISVHMEGKSVRLAHQYKGADDNISCSAAVSSQLPKLPCTAVFRQYNSCCLLKSARRNKISPVFSPSHNDVVLVPGKEHSFVSSPHTRVKKSVCKPSVLSKISFNRMDVELSSSLSNCGHLWPTRYGSFRFCSKSPGKEMCVLERRPKGPGHRCFFSQLGGGGGEII